MEGKKRSPYLIGTHPTRDMGFQRNLDMETVARQFQPSLLRFSSLLTSNNPVLSLSIVNRTLEQLRLSEAKFHLNPKVELFQIAYGIISEEPVCLEEKNGKLSVIPMTDIPDNIFLGILIKLLKNESLPIIEASLNVTKKEFLQLNHRRQLVIILRFLERFSLAETAEIMGNGIKENNIKIIQNRAVQSIKDVM